MVQFLTAPSRRASVGVWRGMGPRHRGNARDATSSGRRHRVGPGVEKASLAPYNARMTRRADDPDDAGDEFAKLRRVIEILRGPNGCPWDREQTLADVARYLGEESAEVADAISESENTPSPSVRDELGDVLMNVLLAARIAEEKEAFSIDDICRSTREKLVRRHPHVFGDARADTPAEVLERWQAIKAEERRASGEAEAVRPRRLASVPRSLPPLARAYELTARAAKFGFDWPDATGPIEKVREELREVTELLVPIEDGEDGARLEAPAEASQQARLEEELGDLLFSTINLCRKLGVHPDAALRRTLKKFVRRFEIIEERIPDLDRAGLAAMDAIWNELRAREADPSRDARGS